MLKVAWQPLWYALGWELIFTVKLMWLPGEKESPWLMPHPLAPAVLRTTMIVSAVAGWSVVPLVRTLARGAMLSILAISAAIHAFIEAHPDWLTR